MVFSIRRKVNGATAHTHRKRNATCAWQFPYAAGGKTVIKQFHYKKHKGARVMFEKIITVTLNPAIDATLWIDRLDFKEPVNCYQQKDYPGGKGLNVSRVLTALDVENIALGIIGVENREGLETLLYREHVQFNFIENEGTVRKNLSIVFPNEEILKINCKGFFVDDAVLNKVSEKIIATIGNAVTPLVVFAGSLPQNVSKEQYRTLVLEAQRAGAVTALDNDIFSIDDLRGLSPFILKPNHLELAHMFGLSEIKPNERAHYAQKLAEIARHVLVSLGSGGLLYCGGGECIEVEVPHVEVKSTVGAGDTTLAGFIAALNRDEQMTDCVRYAAACGTASVLLEGTEAIAKKDALAILPQVHLV